MSLNMIDKFGVPGRVIVGNPKDLTNFRMIDLNDLRNASLIKPDILPNMQKHFATQTGMITELLSYMNSTYDKNVAKFKEKNYGMAQPAWNKNFKMLGTREFAWMTPAPDGFVYRVTTAPTLAGDGTVGRNGAEFIFSVNKQLGTKDDVWLLKDGTTQIILTGFPEPMSDGTLRVRARMLAAPGMHSSAIPGYLLEKNSEIGPSYNLKPEASEHGSHTRVSFGEWHKGHMSTMRWEWNITGHAAHQKVNKDRIAIMMMNERGNVETYWTEVWRYNMMKMAYQQQDNQMFWGLAYTDDEGRFIKDPQGYRYYSGLGLYHQANRRMKREYTKLNDFTLIDDIQTGLYHDALEAGTDVVTLVCGGIEFRKDFDKLIRNEFKGAPEVLYWDGKGNYQIGQGSGSQTMGLKSNFTYYETPVGKFIVSGCNYFDRKSHPTDYTTEGRREQSYRGILMNISKMTGGEDMMTMVTLAGRQNVMGKVHGMSNPGPGGALTTVRDVEGEHLLHEQGVALRNPNCMAELNLARNRR